jgi:putative FmdB family regulatory protein
MGIYVYECHKCWRLEERILPVDQRDAPQTCQCGESMHRTATAGNFRMPGGNPKINYADQFTADMLGTKPEDLPAGIRTPKVTA